MQQTTNKVGALERYGIGVAIAVLFVCGIGLSVKLVSSFANGNTVMKMARTQAEDGNAASQYLLGMAYEQGGNGMPRDLDQAKFWFKKAEAQHFFQAGCELASLHFASGDDTSVSDAQAMQWLQDGTQAGYVNCMNNEAWYEAAAANPALRDPRAAEALAKAVLEKNPDVPQYLDTLAAAYAAEGDFGAAVTAQRSAIARLKSQPRDTTAEVNDMQGRLDLYTAGKPFVESAATAPAAVTSSQAQHPDQGGGNP